MDLLIGIGIGAALGVAGTLLAFFWHWRLGP